MTSAASWKPRQPGEYVGVPFLTRWVESLAVKNQKWWTVLHYATNALRDGTPLAEVVDVNALARFDGRLDAVSKSTIHIAVQTIACGEEGKNQLA